MGSYLNYNGRERDYKTKTVERPDQCYVLTNKKKIAGLPNLLLAGHIAGPLDNNFQF
jgi:hypothetical protein